MKRRQLDDELDRTEAAAGVGALPAYEVKYGRPNGPEAVMEVLAGRSWCENGHGWHDGGQCPACVAMSFGGLFSRDVQ